MKTIAITLILFCTTLLSMGRSNDDTLSSLTIDGVIANAGLGSDKECRVELWLSNGVVDTVILKKGKTKFRLNLRCNSYYTIKISKKGFIDRLICIDTAIPEGYDEDSFRFRFETELLDMSAAKGMNKDMLDFPAAIVHYQESEDYFDYNRAYTDNLKQQLNVSPDLTQNTK